MSKIINGAFSASDVAIMRSSKRGFEALLKSLPKTAHKSMKGRKVANTRPLFEAYILSIHQYGHLLDKIEPVRIQRSHLQRISNNEVNYLYDLHATHAQFVLVVDPETGTAGVADGNTRSTLYAVQDAIQVVPGHVLVIAYFPPSREMADDIYYCIDSAINHKRSRHSLTSMFRSIGIQESELQDGMVANGHLISAFKRLCKLYSLGSFNTKDQAKNAAVLNSLGTRTKHSLQWMASYLLAAKEMDQGVVGALIALKEQNLGVDKHLDSYLQELRMAHNHGASVRGLSTEVRSLWEAICSHGRGKEKYVDYAFARTYIKFASYLREIEKTATAAERKAIVAACAKMTVLPRVLTKAISA